MVVSCTSADGCNRKKIKKTNLQVFIRRSLSLFSIFNHGISTLLHLVKSGKQRLEHALFSECAVSDGPNRDSDAADSERSSAVGGLRALRRRLAYRDRRDHERFKLS
jgi:hypothetical protein